MDETVSMLPDFRRPSAEMLDHLLRVDEGGERWRPHRLLVVNWWLWDQQEFYFGRGWQLFRGPNMAGKSLLLTTVVPLIFDGDKRRHRLDTFGGDGRNADYYVVGASEATSDSDFWYEERIGYAALEFRHPRTGEYRTIGIGLHGRRVGASQVDSEFWGFVVRDGRRVGIDVPLVNLESGAPLTRAELEEALGANPVVGRPADYQAAVNDALFGFRTVEEFRHAMDITLSLRRPGLNKDLKPEDMCRLLSESLPEIDPDVLGQMAGTLEDIDRTRKSIEDTVRHLNAVRSVDEALGAYLNQLAQRRALHFQGAEAGWAAADAALASSRAVLASEAQTIREASERRQALDEEEAGARGRKAELELSEAYADQSRLQALQSEVHGAAEAVDRAARAVSDRERDIERAEDRAHRVRREWDGELARQCEGQSELREQVEAARWSEAGGYLARLGSALDALREPGAEGADSAPVAVLESLGESRLGALGKAEEARAAVDAAEAAMERAHDRLEHAQKERSLAEEGRSQAQEALTDARTNAAAAIIRWAEGTVEVTLARDDRTEMVDGVHAYAQHADDPSSLAGPAERVGARRQEEVEVSRAGAQLQLGERRTARERVANELEEWKARKEAVPEPRPGQVEVRHALHQAGVRCVPLYACVDVRPGVPQAVALAVEAALEAAGLLDAVVVAGEDRDRARERIAASARLAGDRWLDPQAPAVPGRSLLEVLTPVECDVPAPDVATVLRSIGLNEAGRSVSMIGEDGSWHLGVLGGASSAGEPSLRFVGETNRRRVREEQIRALQSEAAVLDGEIRDLEASIGVLTARLATIRTEVHALRALPELARLRSAAFALSEAAGQVARLSEKVQRETEEVNRRHGEVLRTRTTLLAALAEVPEAGRDATVSGLRSLAEHTRAAMRTARVVSQALERFSGLRARLAEAGLDEAAARDALVEAATALASARLEMRGKESQRDALRDRLQRMGLDDLMTQIHQLTETIARCERERLEVVEARAAAAARLQGAERDVAAAEASLEVAVRQREDAVRELRAAVRIYPAPALVSARGLLEDPNEGPPAAARHLLRLRRSTPERLSQEVEEGVERHQRELWAAFADTRSTLAEYAPERRDDGMVTYRFHGSRLLPHAMAAEIGRQREAQEMALRQDEDRLYEEFFLNELSSEIQKRIEEARELKKRINALLAGKRFGRGALAFSVDWKARADAGGEYAKLVELLERDVDLLPPEHVAWIKDFFRRQVLHVRTQEADGKLEHTYAFALREVFDYRKWFEFRLFSQEGDGSKLELRGARFRRGSGAQKALGIFCPLVAAAHARFSGARNADAPRVIGLDEAFAGVDPANMDEMIRFLVELEFSVVMTSEKLWGTSASLPACATYDLQSTGRVAAARLWLWDGAVRVPDMPASGTLLSIPIEVAHVETG
ncbi:MAG TPA: TIGR02680 family protein [Longimicrobium sp.]|jgi:uncharacterized protein (TIGR02680 family)|uniref:TIGR02680 family protein n=1 Tax=Longimicrobium sp. TaxID=2029185 RepID=UPI002ED8BAF8